MAVTKEVYNLPIGFTVSDLADIYRDAFIDAGYMANWYDSFTESGRQHRVMELTYDALKTYGKTYFNFCFQSGGGHGVFTSMGTGFDTGTHTFTGTQFQDYHVQPPAMAGFGGYTATPISTPNVTISNTQEYFLYRYTSTVDPTQSWFMSRVGTTYSPAFSFLHPSASIHPWIDMDLGPVSSLINVSTTIRSNAAVCAFGVQENLRRCVGIGSALSGNTDVSFGHGAYHYLGLTTHAYVAPGLAPGSGATSNNFGAGTVNNFFAGGGHIVLPIGRTSINSEYASDFTPVCTNVPFSYYTNALLAEDFGIYGHYDNNIQAPLDKFITTPGVEEWEIVTRAVNDTITTKAGINFLARVV